MYRTEHGFSNIFQALNIPPLNLSYWFLNEGQPRCFESIAWCIETMNHPLDIDSIHNDLSCFKDSLKRSDDGIYISFFKDNVTKLKKQGYKILEFMTEQCPPKSVTKIIKR